MGQAARLNAEKRKSIECFATADIHQLTGTTPILHGHRVPLIELPRVANTVLQEATKFFGKGHVVFECGLEDVRAELHARIRAGKFMQLPTRFKLTWSSDPAWLEGITARAFEDLQYCLRERPYPCGRIDVFCANSNQMTIPSNEDLVAAENVFEIQTVEELLASQLRWNGK